MTWVLPLSEVDIADKTSAMLFMPWWLWRNNVQIRLHSGLENDQPQSQLEYCYYIISYSFWWVRKCLTPLTHWVRVIQNCASNFNICPDNGLSPVLCQVIIQTKVGLLLLGPMEHTSVKFECHFKHFLWIVVCEMLSISPLPRCVNRFSSVPYIYGTEIWSSLFLLMNHLLAISRHCDDYQITHLPQIFSMSTMMICGVQMTWFKMTNNISGNLICWLILIAMTLTHYVFKQIIYFRNLPLSDSLGNWFVNLMQTQLLSSSISHQISCKQPHKRPRS